MFVTAVKGGQCVPYGKAMDKLIGEIYNWLSNVMNCFLPFVLLLTMTIVIIHTLCQRTKSGITKLEGHDQGQSDGQGQIMKKSDIQIFITLLLV